MSRPKNVHMECGEQFVQGEQKQAASGIHAVSKARKWEKMKHKDCRRRGLINQTFAIMSQ